MHPRARFCAIALALATLLAPTAHARGGRGGGGGGRAKPAAARSPQGPFDARRFHADARAYDIAVVPPPDDPANVAAVLVPLLAKRHLRVAPPGAVARAAGSGSDEAVARAVGCRYVARITITRSSSRRALASGDGIGRLLPVLAGGGLLRLAGQLLSDAHIGWGVVAGVVTTGVLVAGIKLTAEADVEVALIDGDSGQPRWSGRYRAQRTRRFLALLANKRRLLVEVLRAATRGALEAPQAPPPPDPWASMESIVKGDPWAHVSTKW